MKTGYPRFFIHLAVQELQKQIRQRYGRPNESVMLFPSQATARRCRQFFYNKLDSLATNEVRILQLNPRLGSKSKVQDGEPIVSGLSCVFFPEGHFGIAKQVWQHSGDGISSRRAEFCLNLLKEGFLEPSNQPMKAKPGDGMIHKGPRRYQRGGSQSEIIQEIDGKQPIIASQNLQAPEGKEYSQFIEERFGRNLNAVLASQAKLAIQRRIAGCLLDDVELDKAPEHSSDCRAHRIHGLTPDDVYLFPTGMSAIFNTHRILRAAVSESRKSICFGFPYVDTLKILQKWGPGALFYGGGDDSDLDDLEQRLQNGERYLALFTEFPSNPLLKSPNLPRIRALADLYDFTVVVDETVGNFININALPYADVVVSSLTKVFSGDSNVMGGSCVLNPQSRLYDTLKQTMIHEYEDNYWAEDAIFMERNSRDFVSRCGRINVNAEAMASSLQESPLVKQVYYPKFSPSRSNYDHCRHANGGYGGLLSVTFKRPDHAVSFFDAFEVQKGPSLGTNFTLSCPYTILAHYAELDWTTSVGVEPDLVRISVGLEGSDDLVGRVRKALAAAANALPESA